MIKCSECAFETMCDQTLFACKANGGGERVAQPNDGTGVNVYVVTDDFSHELIGIWSSKEKAQKWLDRQVAEGAWTPGEAAAVAISPMTVE